MRRTMGLGLLVAMLAAGCKTNPDDPAGGSPGAPTTPVPVTASDGSSPGEGNATPETILPVSPDPPGEEGGTTNVSFKVEATGSDQIEGSGAVRPVVLLARDPAEGQRKAGSAPAGAGLWFTSWGNYSQRALLVVTAGSQPDASHRIKVTNVSVIEGGKVIEIFARIVRSDGAAPDRRVPWAVISINLAATVLAKNCDFQVEGATALRFACG